MKRTFAVILAFAFYSLIIPAGVGAVVVDSPHFGATAQSPDGTPGVDTLNTCSTCHSTHNTLGSTGFDNLCISCHRSGDAAAGKNPITIADAADPFKNHSTHGLTKMFQTSHRWDGDDTVPAAGAQPPIQAGMTSVNLKTTVGNNLACVRCHNPHNQIVLSVNPTTGEKTYDKNFYRIPNDKDQLCMDCHRSRDVQSHTKGSHPVNVQYPSVATPGFNTPPVNANPANPSSAVKLNNGSVICSTCHGVHFSDSRSSTVDGSASFTKLSTGDGYLLRTDNRGKKVTTGTPDKVNICTNCHAGKSNHNYKNQNVQCVDCHGAHVEFDPNDPDNTKGTNVYLVRRNVSKFNQPSQIMFRYTGSKREYVNATNTGVCQGCHDVPAPGGIYPAQHDSKDPNVCNNCHFHGNTHGSFAGACNDCHGHPPKVNTPGLDGLALTEDGKSTGMTSAGAHVVHVTGRGMDCSTCHNGYANRAMPNKVIDIGFAINGLNVPGFKNSNTNGQYVSKPLINGFTWAGSVTSTGTSQTCANMYCHGATLTNGSNNKLASWTGGSSQSACGACHGTFFDTAPTTGSHGKHVASSLMQCDYCHGSHNDNSHVNGAVEWNFASSDPTATYKTPAGIYVNAGATKTLAPSTTYGSCNNTCHGKTAYPNWGGALYSATEQCAKCHSSSATVTATGLFYSTSYPTQVTADTDSKAGAHASHLKALDGMSASLTCTSCHAAVTTVNQYGHMNGTTEIVWSTLATTNGAVPSYDPATGVCSNVYCHGSNMPNGDVSGNKRAPSWKTPFISTTNVAATCGACHGFPPPAHNFTSTSTTIAAAAAECEPCHPNINLNATGYTNFFITKSLHINGTVDVNATCDACHGYPPRSKNFVGAGVTGNWKFAKIENYSGAGGAHTVVGHVPKTADIALGWANCSKCHDSKDHKVSPKVFTPSSNITVRINSRDRFSGNRTAKYTSNNLDGVLHVPGTCSNVACHFQKSPKW